MAATISVMEAVFDSIRYFRYRGAALNHIDSHAGIRTEREDFANKRKRALEQLEKEKRSKGEGSFGLFILHRFAQLVGRLTNLSLNKTTLASYSRSLRPKVDVTCETSSKRLTSFFGFRRPTRRFTAD